MCFGSAPRPNPYHFVPYSEAARPASLDDVARRNSAIRICNPPRRSSGTDKMMGKGLNITTDEIRRRSDSGGSAVKQLMAFIIKFFANTLISLN
uniref:Uncharacterized protein n=1 Tax=Coccidioides posadasii RMSCC 3488 TaxID=454284 RepID=A0A0J6F7B9_COCPO|nr:hypothetical protein CPAG_01527 [Coccidioides posadasii RMSCC 3488]